MGGLCFFATGTLSDVTGEAIVMILTIQRRRKVEIFRNNSIRCCLYLNVKREIMGRS